MKDYYSILGVNPGANKSEIRKAYRKSAKELHPDLNSTEVKAGNDFILLKEAYEVLINPETRRQYDFSRTVAEEEKGFDYRGFLKEYGEDNFGMAAKLICYDLLHDRDQEAVELYDRLTESGIFDFRAYTDREEFMDYSFLLAEEYLRQNCPVKAFRILYAIALLEEDKAYFKHFYPEVLDRLHAICRLKMNEDDDDLVKLRFLHDISILEYPARDKARILKKISEIYSYKRDAESAKKYLYKAFRANPESREIKEAIEEFEKLST